jgi:hypothetical protein
MDFESLLESSRALTLAKQYRIQQLDIDVAYTLQSQPIRSVKPSSAAAYLLGSLLDFVVYCLGSKGINISLCENALQKIDVKEAFHPQQQTSVRSFVCSLRLDLLGVVSCRSIQQTDF